MNNKNNLIEIKKIISKLLNLKVEELDLDSGKQNIHKWDSLNQVKIILEIEKKFKVKFGADNYEDLDSIKKIINLVKKKTN